MYKCIVQMEQSEYNNELHTHTKNKRYMKRLLEKLRLIDNESTIEIKREKQQTTPLTTYSTLL